MADMRARSVSILLFATLATPALAAPAAQETAASANRLTWGASAAPADSHKAAGNRWLDAQLKHPDDTLPPEAAAQIAAMRISRAPLAALVVDEDAAIRYTNKLPDPAQRDAATFPY